MYFLDLASSAVTKVGDQRFYSVLGTFESFGSLFSFEILCQHVFEIAYRLFAEDDFLMDFELKFGNQLFGYLFVSGFKRASSLASRSRLVGHVIDAVSLKALHMVSPVKEGSNSTPV